MGCLRSEVIWMEMYWLCISFIPSDGYINPLFKLQKYRESEFWDETVILFF